MGTNFAFYCTKHGSGLDKSAESTLQGATSQDEECAKGSSAREPESIAKSIHHMDPMFYMYTSGTTGMPKAVIITHIKSVDLFSTGWSYSILHRKLKYTVFKMLFDRCLNKKKKELSLSNSVQNTSIPRVKFSWITLYWTRGRPPQFLL